MASVGRKVCIVEDDPAYRTALQQLLESKGHRVLAFERSLVAYDELQRLGRGAEKPDLFLIDNLLPDQLGKDLCKRLRESPAYRDATIVLMSSMDVTGQLARDAELQFGCSAFMAKPLRSEQLDTLIATLDPLEGDEPVMEDLPEAKAVAANAFGGHVKIVAPMAVAPSGKITDDGLDVAQIFSHLHSQRFSGILQLLHQQNDKKIFFESGEVVFASSTMLAEKLPALAQRKGWVTSEQVQDARVLAHSREEDLDQVFLQLGVLKPHQVFELHEEAVKAIVYGCFLIEEGTYACHAGVKLPASHIRLKFDFPSLLAASIAMSCDESHLLARLGSGDWILCPSESFRGGLEKLNLGPQERKAAALANGTIPVNKILEESSLSEQEALQVLYSLYCLGFLKQAAPLAVPTSSHGSAP